LVTLHDPSMTLTTGFALKNSHVIGNSDDGIEFDGVTATDVTFKGDIIAANVDDGVFINDSDTSDGFVSSLTDFAIQNSHLGEVRDMMGTLIFAGNGANGFDAQ